jgi:hypothetical protein
MLLAVRQMQEKMSGGTECAHVADEKRRALIESDNETKDSL